MFLESKERSITSKLSTQDDLMTSEANFGSATYLLLINFPCQIGQGLGSRWMHSWRSGHSLSNSHHSRYRECLAFTGPKTKAFTKRIMMACKSFGARTGDVWCTHRYPLRPVPNMTDFFNWEQIIQVEGKKSSRILPFW